MLYNVLQENRPLLKNFNNFVEKYKYFFPSNIYSDLILVIQCIFNRTTEKAEKSIVKSKALKAGRMKGWQGSLNYSAM